jgi:arginine exporter protein ArgO
MNKYIQEILIKKMTRKEFLVYFGMFFLTIFGISSLLKKFSKLNPQSKKITTSNNNKKTTFGARAYGV